MDLNNTTKNNSQSSEQEDHLLAQSLLAISPIFSDELQIDIDEAIEMAEEAKLMELLQGSEE